MKKLFLSLALLIAIFFVGVNHKAYADVYVNGYYRSNGTYVQPYWRSDPDGNPYNNFSFPGNYNPYTDKYATGNPSTYLDNYSSYYDYYTPSYNYDYSSLYDSSSYSDYSSYDSSSYDWGY